MGVARLPPAQMTLMMESLVQPEEGLSGGRKGRDPPEGHGQCLRARGENCSGQTQWTSGALGCPWAQVAVTHPWKVSGTCAEGSAWRHAGLHTHGQPSLAKPASPLVPESF